VHTHSQVLLTTAYLPPILHFAYLVQETPVLIEQHENYIKQTYRNRCTILSANGPLSLTIPTVKKSGEKIPIKDVEIDYSTPWQKIHWKALESAYQNSPYFEHIADELAPYYNKRVKFLFDLNQQLIETLLAFIEVSPTIRYTETYSTTTKSNTLDLRQVISPKVDFASTELRFEPQPYYQVFGQKGNFVPNLSIIDLICNQGLLSLEILEKSIK